MTTFNKGNLKLALASLRYSRGRSLLTILGIMIGVTAVISIIAIGEGLKQQLKTETGYLGSNIVTILPSQSDNLLKNNLATSLSPADATAISRVPGVTATVPLGTISGTLTTAGAHDNQVTIVAAGPQIGQLLDSHVAYGSFTGGTETTTSTAVIGPQVATRLFKEQIPLGQSFSLRGQRFIVQGVLSNFSNTPLSPTANFNNAVIIPIDIAASLPSSNLLIYQIVAQIDKAADVPKTMAAISQAMTASHDGQADFQVLAPGQTSASDNHLLTTLTAAVGGIAAISLLVGGIGIMNVMLVSVTERMQEIGIRKAVGATNRQILKQFLTEAVVLSVIGGVLGVGLSLAINGTLRVLTDLQPVMSWQVMVIAFVASLVLGVLFGSAPAIKAARKDPIDALRVV